LYLFTQEHLAHPPAVLQPESHGQSRPGHLPAIVLCRYRHSLQVCGTSVFSPFPVELLTPGPHMPRNCGRFLTFGEMNRHTTILLPLAFMTGILMVLSCKQPDQPVSATTPPGASGADAGQARGPFELHGQW